LQNPVYYSSAQENWIIRWLPAFYPCQSIFSASFTDRLNPAMFIRGILYAGVLVGVLFLIINLRLRRVRYRPGERLLPISESSERNRNAH